VSAPLAPCPSFLPALPDPRERDRDLDLFEHRELESRTKKAARLTWPDLWPGDES
jgi:hypothetical protein